MPRPGPARQRVTIRLLQAAIDFLDREAEAEGLVDRHGRPNRSEMARVMLAYATLHRPRGWRPPEDTDR